MRQTLMLAIMTLMPMQAQDNPVKVSKLIEIKYADIHKVGNLIMVFAGKNTRVQIDPIEGRHYVALNGPAGDVEVVERFIKELDVPPPPERNIELTIYMLLGQQANPGEKLPVELAPVVRQLQATFNLKEFRLLETYVGRMREGKGTETSGLLSIPSQASGAPPASYNLRVQRCSISGDEKARTIRLDNMRLGGRIPYPTAGGKEQWQFMETIVSTDIDVREGQKIVVGKTNIGSKDSLFYVVTAKVVE